MRLKLVPQGVFICFILAGVGVWGAGALLGHPCPGEWFMGWLGYAHLVLLTGQVLFLAGARSRWLVKGATWLSEIFTKFTTS